MFIGLLTITTSVVSASSHTKCLYLSNQKRMTLPTIIDLHCNE